MTIVKVCVYCGSDHLIGAQFPGDRLALQTFPILSRSEVVIRRLPEE